MARRAWSSRFVLVLLVALAAPAALTGGCGRRAKAPAEATRRTPAPAPLTGPPAYAHAPIPRRAAAPTLAAGETLVYRGDVAEKQTIEAARAASLLDVDLGDDWSPFIFHDSSGDAGDPPKPNGYRTTFIELANDRLDPEGRRPRRGDHNYLEVFGIPPTLSVLATRVEQDLQPARQGCFDGLDLEPLRRFTGTVGYLDHNRAKRDFVEAARDADWIRKQANGGTIDEALMQSLRADPKRRGRADRYLRGQARLRAVRAAQAYLVCDRLLSPDARTRFTDGMFDLPTHEALADWERKNDIFGWGFLGGEPLANLLRAPLEMHFDTFKRILVERLADAAAIVEDGSAARGRGPATYRDSDGTVRPVPNLIQQHVDALLASLHVSTPEEMVAFLRSHAATAGLAALHVAFKAPPLPAYYYAPPAPPAPLPPPPSALASASPAPSSSPASAPPTPTLAVTLPDTTATPTPARAAELDLAVEIDRGDVWYDFPYNARGRPTEQRRDRFPHLTMFVRWNDQKIPLCRWRTTIGTWRSELHPDGRIYMKYKNSDVGPRVWKNIVAGPVWIPPDGTQPRDLLTRKVLDRGVGPVTVVNSDVMGPGFQSAYGLVLAIHVDPRRGDFDNQIRTHGSVDYTSIARRFSHGCHRLVNNRAVRLFDFALRHRAFRRVGAVPVHVRKKFTVDGKSYAYRLDTRGYYYELMHPIPVDVSEGRIMGTVKRPILSFVRKPGVDYSGPAIGDAAASIGVPSPEGSATEPPAPPEGASELGP